MYKTISLERLEDHVVKIRMTRETEMNTLKIGPIEVRNSIVFSDHYSPN